MPPRPGSRYAHCTGLQDTHGRRYLSTRVPYRFVPHADNRRHLVQQGDSWWSIAAQYFAPLPRACTYWWAVADFQPAQPVDPTVPLEPGAVIVVPSLRVLTDLILSGAYLEQRTDLLP